MAATDPLPDTTAQKEESQPPPKSEVECEAESGVSTETSDIPLEPKTEDLCVDCEKAHLPQRLVIFHDGTWMLPDGAIGK